MSISKEGTYSYAESFANEPNGTLQNIREKVDDLLFCHVAELEDSLRYVIPEIIRIIEQIYSKNNAMVESNQGGVIDLIRTNFQAALSLMDISNDILQCVMQSETVALSTIPSVPVNVAHILFLTFEHCKNGQKTYSCRFKSVTEIVELFRKTQEVHSKFLIFLDSYLSIDFLNENEIIAYREILDIILKISKTLSGINMKSMADNWKSFIALVQKSSSHNVTVFNLSPAIQILTEEINSNLLAISKMESSDLKKASQSFKVTGFLVKVVLKLFETNLNITDNFENILGFWIMIFSWHSGTFQTNKYADEIVDHINTIFNLCSESAPDLIFRDYEFLNQFCLMMHKDFIPPKQSYSVLLFTNAAMREIPKLLHNEPDAFNNFSLVQLLRLAFKLSGNCYLEHFCDYNSEFYEKFVINVSVAVLLFPEEFSEIENVLLNCVLGDNIWAAMIAIDAWSLILRYASPDVCRSTLAALVNIIEDLKPGTFQQTPVIVRLKILTQRILKSLSDTARNEEITKYSPTSHLSVWKILNLRNIPLSHRYYIEFLVCDIIEKMDLIEEPNCSVNDVLTLMENFETISYSNFGYLEINANRLVPLIMRLWAFDIRDISLSNNFAKYFTYKLIKATIAVSNELSGENLILVLTQLKVLLGEVLCKLLSCALLQSMAKRNFSSFQEKNTLFSLMSSFFQLLLADKNAVVVQTSLEVFLKISDSSNYESVVHKVSTCSSDVRKMIANYTQRTAGGIKYTVKYFDKIQTFTNQHKCYEWTNVYQPVRKKIKVDSDVNIVINNLNSEAEKLVNLVMKVELDEKQKGDIRGVVNKLEFLLK